MNKVIFIIGPGGVGKSSLGPALAEKSGYKFLDLDAEFCERIQNIREYLAIDGYESYLEENANVLHQLLEEYADEKIIIALSSGFLSTDIREDIVVKNKLAVAQRGLSILLMPSEDYAESLECVVERQLQRGFSLAKEKEEQKFSQRFFEYCRLGDIQVFSTDSPANIADLIMRKPEFIHYIKSLT